MPISMNAIRTQTEVAKILTERGDPMSRATVQAIETQALKKLARDPRIIAIALEAGVIADEPKTFPKELTR
jgi:hypothetical protein